MGDIIEELDEEIKQTLEDGFKREDIVILIKPEVLDEIRKTQFKYQGINGGFVSLSFRGIEMIETTKVDKIKIILKPEKAFYYGKGYEFWLDYLGELLEKGYLLD